MQKNFTHLIQAIGRARSGSTIVATLLLFMLLLLAKSASAQAVNPTPGTQSVCVGAPVSFTSSYNGSGNDKAGSLQWQYSPTGVENSYQTVQTVNVTTDSYTTTYNINITTTSNTGYYRVRYLRPNGNILATTNPAILTVNPFPTATITTTTPLTFCSEGSVLLSANTGTGFTYLWQKDGNPAPGTNTGSTYTATESGSYRVVITSNTCATTSVPVIVNEIQTPTATIANPATPTTFCAGNFVDLTAVANPATPASPGTYIFTWYNGATAIPNATSATYRATETGNYSVVITNKIIINGITFNCSSPASTPIPVTVNPFPTATITTTTPLTFCSEGSVLLSANTGTGFTYLWQKDGNPAPGTNTGSTYTATESGSYRVVITSNTCATTSLPVTVNEILTPAASITTPAPTTANPTPTTFCTGGSVILSAVATPATAPASGSYSYTWFNGTTAIPGATASTYTATTSGNYSVVITNTTASISCPSPASTPVTVTVNPFPTAEIDAPNGTSSCPGGTVRLTVTPVTGATYVWLLNNAPITNANSPEYDAPSTGNYRVQVTNNGCTTTSNPVAITILSPATVIAEGPTASFCAGTPVILHAVTGTGYTYQWFKVINGISEPILVDGNSANLSVTEAGDYRVTVTITNANSCVTISDITSVTQTPAIVNNTIVAPTATTICANTSPGTIAGGIPGPSGGNNTSYNYEWQSSTDGGTNFTRINFATGPSYTPGVLTTTTIFRRVVTSECSSISNTVTITVNPVIAGNTITAPQISTICAGSAPATITGVVPTGGNGVFTYQWQSRIQGVLYADIQGATGQDYAPGNLTETTLFRRIANSGACSDISDAIQITVNPLPTASAGADQVLCSPASGTTLFTLQGVGTNANYQWVQINSTNGASANIRNANQLNSGVDVTGIGSVTLQLTATSNSTPACGNPIIDEVVLTVNPSPTAIAGADQAACFTPNGTAFTLAGQGANGTFLWEQVNFTGTATASIANNTSLSSGVSVTGVGTVTLRLTTSSNTNPLCGKATDEIILTVNPLPTASAGADQVLCSPASGTTLFTLQGVGTNANYQWVQINSTNGASANIRNANQLNSGVDVTGIGSVTLQLTATSNSTPACGNPIIDEVVLTVNPSPTAIAGADQAACFTPNGTAFTLAGQGANGTFLWEQVNFTGTATASIANNTSLSSGVSVTGVGTVTLRLTTSSNTNPLCGKAAAEVTLTVNPIPTANAGSVQALCASPAGTTFFQLAGQGSNGTFQWTQFSQTGTANATFTDATALTTGVNITGIGTVTLRLTTTSNATPTCAPPATSDVVLTVNPQPVASLPDFNDRCVTSPVFALVGSYTGVTDATVSYTYNGPAGGLSVNSNGVWIFNPAVAGAGTWPITYTVSKNGCSSSQTKALTVKETPPTPTFTLSTGATGINPGALVFTGEGNKNLSGSLVNATSGIFTGYGVNGTTFNPYQAFNQAIAAAGTPNATQISVAITYTVSNGMGCSNAITQNYIIRKSVYSVVVSSSPKPFCQGVNVDHTVRVYRDVQNIEYPYLVNIENQPIDANGNVIQNGAGNLPVGNASFSSLPANAPQAVRDNAYRFYNPIVTMGQYGVEITSGLTYQWTKNHANNIGSDNQTFSNAGLSSLEYYASIVSVNLPGDVEPDFTRSSTRAYTGALADYDITLTADKNPICPGTLVTFTATLDGDFGYWTTIGLDLTWVLTRNGTRTILNTVTDYTGNTTQLQFATTGPNGGNFADGDRISIEFTSDIDQFYGGSKCAGDLTSTPVTMTVAKPQTLSSVGAYCAGGTGVTITMNDSQVGIFYQLLRNGVNVGNQVAGTGNAINFNNQLAGSYTIQAIVSGSLCLTYGPITVTENPLPAAPEASNQVVCSNGNATQTLTATATVPAGFSVIWYTTANGPATTTTPTQVGVGSKTYYAALQNTTTTCISDTRTPVTLTINALPTEPTVSNSTVSACTDGTATQTLTATATVPSGFNLIWFTTANGSETTTTPTQVGVGSKTYYAATQNPTTLCFSANRTPVTLTIYDLPAPPTASNQEVCSDGDATQTLTATATVPAGFSVIWYTTANGPATTTTPTQVGVGSKTYYAALQNTTTTCISATRTPVSLTIKPLISHNVTIDGPFEEDANKNGEIEVGGKASYTAITILDGVPVTSPVAASYKWTIVVIGKQTKVINTSTNKLMVDPVEGIMTITVEEVITDGRCFDNVTATSTNEPFTPLPVEMLYLKAEKKQNNLVVLEWATAMEKMNEGFQIEVSQDARNYRVLSFVPTKNGNTNAKQVYTFHDKENGKYGTRYYRLKQMDVDGTSEYFGPKAVQMDELSEQIVAYPNPFTSQINLDVNAEAAGSMHVIVTNAVGGKVLERTLSVEKGSNKAQLQLNPNLPLGMYIITTRLNGTTNHVKLMKK